MDEPMASVPAPHATLKSASRLRLFFEWLPFRFPFSLAWLASCPNRCPFFFLFQVVVTRGGMRRPASPCEQTAVQIRHLANCDEGERLANCDEGERRSNRPTDPPAQCAVMIGCTGSCGDRRQQFPAAEGAVVPSRWGGRSRCRRAPRAWPRATPRAVPLPPHAPTRLRESSGTHSTTHQPHLDQNS